MISVVIPIYNSSSYLTKCLDSILNQTYKNLEIILVDDGSTDGSTEICENYAYKDHRFKVIKQKNLGVAIARNQGLKYINGDYVSFIDSDDWIHPCFFEKLLYAIENCDADLSLCLYEKNWNNDFGSSISLSKNITFEEINKHQLYEMLLAVPINKYRSCKIPYDTLWGKLYKRDIIQGKEFKKIWASDAEFNSRVYNSVDKAILIRDNLYFWFQYPGSLHRKESYKGLSEFIMVNWEIYNNLSLNLKKEKSKAIQRVFLSILSSRYILNHYPKFKPSKKKVQLLSKIIIKRLIFEFVINRDISVLFKIAILLFIYMPISYNLYRFLAAKIYEVQSK